MRKVIAVLMVFVIVLGLGGDVLASGSVSPPVQVPEPTSSPGQDVRSICLEVKQSFSDVETEVVEPIVEVVTRVLTAHGITVAEMGSSCEATLSIDLKMKPRGLRYSGAPKDQCYTGAEAEGTMALTSAGDQPRTYAVSGTKPTPRIVSRCPDKEEAPFERAWIPAVLEGLGHIWGVGVVVSAVRDEAKDVREEAVTVLRRFEPTGETIAALIGALDDASPIPNRAEEVLTGIGEQAVPALLAALKGEESSEMRAGAAKTLGMIGQQDGVVEALTEALRDESPVVRQASAIGLHLLRASSPEAVAGLIEALGDEDEGVRQHAVSALRDVGAAEQIIPLLLGALDDEDHSVRKQAIHSLRKQVAQASPEQSREVVDALARMLRDSNEVVRWSAANALGGLGASVEGVLEDLADALEDENVDVRLKTISALKQIGAPAFPILLEALRSSDTQVCEAAAKALGDMGPDAVLPIIRLLADGEWQVRAGAAAALGQLGPEPGVVSALIASFADERPEVREAAVRAFGRIGLEGSEVPPSLLGALKDEDPRVRLAVADVLGSMTRATEEVVPVLLGSVDDESTEVRLAVIRALGAMDDAAGKVGPVLLDLVHDDDPAVRIAAIRALGNLEAFSDESVPVLSELLQAEDAEVQKASRNALITLGVDYVSVLAGRLEDPDPEVRELAAETLGLAGRKAMDAVPLLIDALDDDSPRVRFTVFWALEKITGEALGMDPQDWRQWWDEQQTP